MFVTARPPNLQKNKQFKPGSAAVSRPLPHGTNALAATNAGSASSLNLNKLNVTAPAAVQSSQPATTDTDGTIRERIPVYAPTADQLQQYYYVAKFMTSAITNTSNDKKLSLHAKMYKPVRNKHKSYALIKQEKKLDRAKNRALKKAGQLNDAESSDSDDDEKQVLRKWRIEDAKRKLSFIGQPEQLKSSVSRSTAGQNDYALLVMQHDKQNKPYFDMVPVSRFVNFRAEEGYEHVRSLDEAEQFMKRSQKIGERWLQRSSTLKKYETEKLLDMEEQGIEIDRELAASKLIDSIDDDKLKQRMMRIEQQRSRLNADDDNSRRVKKERANDFTDKFSDDEGGEVNEDKDDGVQSDDSAAYDDEANDDAMIGSAGKRSSELLQKADANQLPQQAAGEVRSSPLTKTNDAMDDDSGIDDDGAEFSDDDLYISGEDDDAMDTGAGPSASPVNKRPSPVTSSQRSSTPQPPSSSATRKRRTDNAASQQAAGNNHSDVTKKAKVDTVLTQQDIIQCFRVNQVLTVSQISGQLQNKLKELSNRKLLADYLKGMCSISNKELRLLPQFAT